MSAANAFTNSLALMLVLDLGWTEAAPCALGEGLPPARLLASPTFVLLVLPADGLAVEKIEAAVDEAWRRLQGKECPGLVQVALVLCVCESGAAPDIGKRVPRIMKSRSFSASYARAARSTSACSCASERTTARSCAGPPTLRRRSTRARRGEVLIDSDAGKGYLPSMPYRVKLLLFALLGLLAPAVAHACEG